MPITGTWVDARAYQSGALKWGHGVNPIHGIPDSYGGRSGKAPTTQTGPNGPAVASLNPDIIDPELDLEYGYTEEDFSNQVWGYGTQTGTSDRPSLGVPTERSRGDTTKDWPAAGPYQGGMPGGSQIRAQKHGEIAKLQAKLGDKEETVGEGWENKIVGTVENSVVSDPSQYERQTAMQQRDQVRRGTQNPNSGTASEFKAPIGSERPTWSQRIKPWSGGRRHYDMTPREQNQVIRPFWYRNAGTGYREWLAANQQHKVVPLQRQPVPDPYAGNLIPNAGNVYQEESYPVQDYVNVWW
jgi:hypothetical protein